MKHNFSFKPMERSDASKYSSSDSVISSEGLVTEVTKVFKKSSSVSDLQSMNRERQVVTEHNHTSDCQTTHNDLSCKHSLSTTDLTLQKKIGTDTRNMPIYNAVKTRLSASAEAFRLSDSLKGRTDISAVSGDRTDNICPSATSLDHAKTMTDLVPKSHYSIKTRFSSSAELVRQTNSAKERTRNFSGDFPTSGNIQTGSDAHKQSSLVGKIFELSKTTITVKNTDVNAFGPSSF